MAQMSHLAVLLHGPSDLRLTRVLTPSPLPHEVQIRPRATGICGSDMHYYSAGRNGVFKITTPLVLGHEAAGEVVAVGSEIDAKDVKVGDRVAVEPQRPCGSCKECSSGKYNLCPKLKFMGSASSNPPVQGSLQELYCHTARFVHKLPDGMSWTEGAMVEPLSVAIHAVRRSGLRAGQRALVLGAGAIGLLCASMARVSGATSVGVIDIDLGRLDFAKERGFADATFGIPMERHESESATDFAARLAKAVVQQEEFELADVVFECTGVEVCVNIGIHCVAPGGKLVLVGMGSPVQNINAGAAAVREVDLLGLWRYANTFDTAIGLISSGKLGVQALVTHTFGLDRAADALELVVAKPADLIKCVITSS